MKSLSSHPKREALILALLLIGQFVTGSGLFCTGEPSRVSQSMTMRPEVFSAASPKPEFTGSVALQHETRKSGQKSCSCKKEKSCPGIPQLSLVSQVRARGKEPLRQLGDHLPQGFVIPQDWNDHYLAKRCLPQFVRAKGDFCCFTPLFSLTCVWLI